jgi:hypothetical protein
LKTEARGQAIERWLAGQNFRPLPWLAVFAILMAVQISPLWYPTPDAATYLSIARSITVNHRLTNLGGAHLGYPPGYPLLIGPAFLISARPFLIISMMHWVMALLFMMAVYRWMRRLAPDGAMLLTGLVMVNAALWIYYRRTLSEMAFMTVMMWAVLTLDSALENGSAMGTAAGTALVIALALIRETGVLLAAGFGVAAVLAIRAGTLRWRRGLLMAATMAAPAIAAVSAFMIYDLATARAAPSAVFGTHLSGFIDPSTPIISRTIEGLRLRISEVGRLLVPGMFKAYSGHGQWLHLDMLIYLGVFAVIALGWARLLRRRDVLAATAPFYLGLYAVWAFDADTRYLLPLLPLLVLSLWFAIAPFTRWRLRFLGLLLLAHLGVALGYWSAVEIPRARSCNRQWAAIDALSPGLKDGSALVVADPRVPQCARLMLSFVTDRPVLQRAPGLGAAQEMLERRDDPNPPGFEVRRAAGPYKLLELKPPG